jgi:hypothetical protein
VSKGVVDATDEDEAPTYEQRSAMKRIATELWRLHEARATGELAALRRMDRHALPPAAFHRLMARIEVTEMNPDAVRRWARIVGIMAQRPDALRASGLGEALAAIGLSEPRLDMLLNAQGPALHDLARRTALRLAGSHDTLPYRDLGHLLAYDGRPEKCREADNVRIRIAQSFIRSRTKSEKAGD